MASTRSVSSYDASYAARTRGPASSARCPSTPRSPRPPSFIPTVDAVFSLHDRLPCYLRAATGAPCPALPCTHARQAHNHAHACVDTCASPRAPPAASNLVGLYGGSRRLRGRVGGLGGLGGIWVARRAPALPFSASHQVCACVTYTCMRQKWYMRDKEKDDYVEHVALCFKHRPGLRHAPPAPPCRHSVHLTHTSHAQKTLDSSSVRRCDPIPALY